MLLLSIATATAYAAPAPAARSILRLQGYRGSAPTGARVAEQIVLVARGVEHHFAVIDRRRFDVETPGVTPPRERDRFTLQGDFDLLAKFSKARDGQLVTILGEQRPGSGDLFLLTVDLCPP